MSRLKSMFGLGPSCNICVQLQGDGEQEKRRTRRVQREEKQEELLVYRAEEPVVGTVVITPKKNKKLEHTGIKVELIGQIVLTTYERVERQDFTSVVRPLDNGGELTGETKFAFEFPTAEKSFDSYDGINAQLRYFLRVTVVRPYTTNVVHEQEFWVENPQEEPQTNTGIKMEVGIEEYLHIEFQYDKSHYSLDDVVLGKVYFVLVKLKIKYMELAVVRRESMGSGAQVYNESETVSRFEIMDGNPEPGENVPVRLFLKPMNLTPTYRTVNNKFSVKYYLNLVLVDEEDRRYFKQQEIQLWRRDPNVTSH